MTLAIAHEKWYADTMRISRTLSPAMLNEIANHPEVRPWLGGVGPIDLSAAVADPLNYALCTDGGGFFCHNLGLGTYEVHSLFLPDARKGRTLPFMRACMEYMFTRTDCVELVTKLPEGNAPAAALASVGGFALRFRREAAWLFDGRAVAVDHVGLSVEQWALASAECLAAGAMFHANVESAKAAAGLVTGDHPDDPAHEYAAGAATLMALAGNPHKAVVFYNKWAAFAGYSGIGLVSVNPPVIDASDGGIRLVLESTPDGMEVLTCQLG